jgi:hypothetical protein
MSERGRSDPEVVAMKPANKAKPSAAESVEPRPRGMRTNKARARHRTGQVCHKRWPAYGKFAVNTRGKSRMHQGARTDLCGGRGATHVPTATEQKY